MEDSHIIQLFFDRAERAIEALSVKYGKLCYRIAYNILTDHADAEECENDTYLRVWNTVPPTWPDNLRAYVSRIVRNLALDRVRYQNRHKRSVTVESFLSELSECVPAAVSVEADADDTAVRAVTAYLNTLDELTRVLFVRRYFFMDSIEMLARQFGMNASSVSTKLTRTRARLKTYLEQEGIVL
ncbi:MAG: sigma-70 family RNA polymerase sigma factor [Lachnospiraceae bacterium]|nr:sigma-70 family RNA polymerase sigma factor [Lachnospiraceae bacterium]